MKPKEVAQKLANQEHDTRIELQKMLIRGLYNEANVLAEALHVTKRWEKTMDERTEDTPELLKCQQCHENFVPAWTDEEANAEAERLFGIKNASTDKDCAVICDDCFLRIFPGGKPI